MVHISAFADEIDPDPVVQLNVLAEHAIRHVEFRSILGKNVLDLDDDDHASFRALMRDRGVTLSAIGSPIGKIAITDPFEPHIERFEKALELALFYEAPRVRVFSFYIPQGDDPGNHRGEVIRRMATLAEIAAEQGVTLFLENEKGIYGDVAERVLDIIEAVDSPALGSAFDPANFLEVGESIENAWNKLREHVIHFHVKDYDTLTHKNVEAGLGAGEIAGLIADLVARGFDGFCTLEPHLIVAEKSYGFTGPDRFGDAARALKGELDRVGVAYR